jgi:hypothetical protein
MFRDQVLGPSLLVILGLCLSAIVQPIPAVAGQVAEPPKAAHTQSGSPVAAGLSQDAPLEQTRNTARVVDA